MPIKPGSAALSFVSDSGSSTIYVDEVTRSLLVEPFTRVEFSNDKLRTAKNDLGGLPMISTSIANIPIQVSITCAGDSARPLTPNTISNLNSVNQRLNIIRYNVRGSVNNVIVLAPLATQAFIDTKLLLKFQYHQTLANSEISYTDLVGLQSETFTYLSATNTSLTGNCIGGTAASLIIRSYVEDVIHSVTLSDGSQLRTATFSAVFDNISFSAQSAG